MKHLSLLCFLMAFATQISAQPWSFDFTSAKKSKTSQAIIVSPTDRYTSATDYGFDFINSPERLDRQTPFYFSVRVPDGNYRVTATLGSKKKAAVTTVRAESRRLFVENLATR